MSFREDSEDGKDLRKPFLHTGSWYRMGSRQSSMMEKIGSSAMMRDGSGGYSSPTQDDIIRDLGLTISEVPVYIAEIAPQDMRGSLGSVNQCIKPIGDAPCS
ncbi:hypothetical protein C5167_010120 [Papaver somniferum]|uniref:Uncharacterized protein n=1 Tax=Papaver somniferum TaxID=3469 RepID=A0A4Y7K2C5_PAPSO|nr:hypothetical protein C5167_010120 [Papaver somniferum]